MNDMEEDLMTPREVSIFLRISEVNLRVWRQKKKGLPYFKVGNKVFYKRKDVDEFMNKGRVEIEDKEE